jgi:hypothetical protein
LLLDGNIFFVLFTDKAVTGKVQVRSILVDEIVNIITNPDDQNEVWYYERRWFAVDSEKLGSPKEKRAFYPDIHYVPKIQPPTLNGVEIVWDAPILHVKTGGLSKGKFGVPETYSALDWASAHQRMLEDWATIIRAYARFAFRLTTPGGKNSVVAAKEKLGTTIAAGEPSSLAERNPSPVAGSIFAARKDGVDLEPIKTAGATTSATDSRQLRLMVAAAMGLPDPMLSGEVDVGNLATAKTLDRPTELKFRSRQQLWTEVYKTIIDHIIKWAIIAPKGLLSKKINLKLNDRGDLVYLPSIDPKTGKPIDLHIEVVFPPILEHTVIERIEAVKQAVTLDGKPLVVDSPELQKLTMRLVFQALGLNDVDELVDLVFEAIIAAKPEPDPTKPATDNTDQKPANDNPNTTDGQNNVGREQRLTN